MKNLKLKFLLGNYIFLYKLCTYGLNIIIIIIINIIICINIIESAKEKNKKRREINLACIYLCIYFF